MKKIVSVIVPVYNVSEYIVPCIESLMNQTMKDIEIIVVDDCSTDDSIYKVEKLARKDKRIKIIHNKTNQGAGESRNVGLKYVESQYVSFMNSDDMVAADFCEKLYKAATKYNADIAVADLVYYYSETKQMRLWTSNYNLMSGKTIVEEPKDKQYNIYACSMCAKLFNMDLFKKHNLKFLKGVYYEDAHATFMTTALANKLVIVKDTTYFYRQREGSIMATTTISRKPFDIFKIYAAIEEFLQNNTSLKDSQEYRQIYENFAIFNIYGYYNLTHPTFKHEFYNKMKKVFATIDLINNKYISSENLKLCKNVLCNDYPLSLISIKLFGIIPLFKYKKTERVNSLYLFDFIPLISYKHK